MKTLALLIGFFLVVQMNAQDTITGKIFDEKNEPIPFANVIVKSNEILIAGASTNFNGDFVIIVPNNKTPKSGGYILEVAYVGYAVYISENFYITNKYEEVENINLLPIEGEKVNKRKKGKIKAEKSSYK
jgi:hypothetical protein